MVGGGVPHRVGVNHEQCVKKKKLTGMSSLGINMPIHGRNRQPGAPG